jgi:peroxiredoxin
MLQNSDIFPSLTFARVILFNRGSWCLYCNAEGIKVVVVSVDDREKTDALVEKYKLSFPVAYGADARAVSAVTVAFINDDPVYLQATGFVLNPEGRRFFCRPRAP